MGECIPIAEYSSYQLGPILDMLCEQYRNPLTRAEVKVEIGTLREAYRRLGNLIFDVEEREIAA